MLNLKSYDHKNFKILSIKKCEHKFLFHSSGKNLTYLDPKFNLKKKAFGNVHEYGIPVVFAGDKPSAAFCYTMTTKYSREKAKVGDSVYHRLFYKDHKILLGAKIGGYIYVLKGSNFYEVRRKDFENGKWEISTEWISPNIIRPIEKIKISKPFDWEMLPEYEFLGKRFVGFIKAEQYLKLAKDKKVTDAILKLISKPFVPTIPVKLKKYL